MIQCQTNRKDIIPAINSIQMMLDSFSEKSTNLNIFKSFYFLCPISAEFCTPSVGDVFIFIDKDHLSIAGDQLLYNPFILFMDKNALSH